MPCIHQILFYHWVSVSKHNNLIGDVVHRSGFVYVVQLNFEFVHSLNGYLPARKVNNQQIWIINILLCVFCDQDFVDEQAICRSFWFQLLNDQKLLKENREFEFLHKSPVFMQPKAQGLDCFLCLLSS